MGLFDIQLDCSPQHCVLSRLETIVSECDVFAHLAERESAELAERVIVGPHIGPWGTEGYTEAELADRLCECQIWSPLEATEEWEETGNVGATAYRRGDFIIRIRRYIRPSETEDRRKLYAHLLAAADQLGAEIMRVANEEYSPRIASLTGSSPAFGMLAETVAQGEYAHWSYMGRWGDIGEE